jgi:flagellar FliJ protein
MQEEEAQLEFSQAAQQYVQEKELENQYHTRLTNTLTTLRHKQQETLMIETLKNFHYYLDKLKGDLQIQTQKVVAASQYRDCCLQKLENAVKSRKVVERLKEKHWQEYQMNILQEEQKDLDEIGIQTYFKEN